VERVSDSKLKDIVTVLKGFMVHDIGLMSASNQLWAKHCPKDNQRIMRSKISICSLRICGLRVPVDNVNVATLFFEAWLHEYGTFAFRGAVEDSATAEISRSQV
jgi:malate synthase